MLSQSVGKVSANTMLIVEFYSKFILRGEWWVRLTVICS